MLIDVEKHGLVVTSKITKNKYKVYKINIENNKITDYYISNLGNMELWDTKRFYPLKANICLCHEMSNERLDVEDAKKEIEVARKFGTSGVTPRWKAIDTLVEHVKELEQENELYRLRIGEPPVYECEFVLKQKIRDKIKEITDKTDDLDTLSYVLQVEPLQQLLEEG